MNKKQLQEQIMRMPVWDVHTHLDISKSICARDIWDIVHYFWFERELQAAGYPLNAMELPEAQRIDELVSAFKKSANTTWSWTVQQMCQNLYGMKITDAASIRKLNVRIAAKASSPVWAEEICNKLNIAKISVGSGDNEVKSVLKARVQVIPECLVDIEADTITILNAQNQQIAAGKVINKYVKKLAKMHKAGVDTLRLEPAPEICFDLDFVNTDVVLNEQGNSENKVKTFIWQSCFSKINEYNMNVQIFIGMRRLAAGAIICSSLNKPERILEMHGLFAKYPGCNFQIVNAAELSNLDLVQAARIFPNVYPTGMWWFNFRVSTYHQTMQYRLEALPSARSILITSDARQIEWCYGKILLVKTLLTDFLWRQIEECWLDTDTALKVAADWLFNSTDNINKSTKKGLSRNSTTKERSRHEKASEWNQV